jgi:hypothetical protein
LSECHVRLAVAPLPVVAHRALGVADPGAVVDQNRRANGVELGVDECIDEVARHTGGRLGEVMQSEGVSGHRERLPSYQPLAARANLKGRRQRGCGPFAFCRAGRDYSPGKLGRGLLDSHTFL